MKQVLQLSLLGLVDLRQAGLDLLNVFHHSLDHALILCSILAFLQFLDLLLQLIESLIQVFEILVEVLLLISLL